jgi:putative transposase
MPRKRHKPEEIVTKLRQVDVLVLQGQGIAGAIRQIGVNEVACVTNGSTAKSSTH